MKGRDFWEDQGTGGEIEINGAKWIRVAQVRVHWQAFVNTAMNLQVP
jgi:hypothetical protein